MIERVHERARLARLPDRVVVATEDPRIADAVRGFGGEVIMTAATHETGTDRVAEAARALDADIIVNVQGDEPMLDSTAIDKTAEALLSSPDAVIATLAIPFETPEEILSPGAVKVVVDGAGNALYFSRSPIPYVRLGSTPDPRASAAEAVRMGVAFKHVGIYAYRRETLFRFSALPQAPLEKAEGLEQLRALQNGIPIRVVFSQVRGGPAVDTQEDLEHVRGLFAGKART
jgi:3-deoxy-manno-octulosonate cytidylyltransferase (CMP-KDO synthetase)